MNKYLEPTSALHSSEVVNMAQLWAAAAELLSTPAFKISSNSKSDYTGKGWVRFNQRYFHRRDLLGMQGTADLTAKLFIS